MTGWLRPISSHRHPGDLVRVGLGLVVLTILTVAAFSGTVGPLEEYIFRAVNALPSFLLPAIEIIMQAGALFFVPIAAILALLQRHKRLPLKILIGGSGAWFIARVAKAFVDRDRPAGLLTDFIERNVTAVNFGFPSGHATVAAVLATVIAPYVPKRWRRPVWTVAWIVALARVFVGVHLPLDVFAGLALGWIIGSLMNLAFGVPDQKLPIKAIREKLKLAGYSGLHIKEVNLDARGSTPLYAEDKNYTYFIKLVDNEHRNADILFKLWRYFIMREVEDEAPFASALQLIEHEAYISEKARQAGVNTPKVLFAAPVTNKAAIIVSTMIDGEELSNYKGPFTTKLLDSIWEQVLLLRTAHIAHRDLRAANIMIDKNRNPWVIDYSFAETAISNKVMTTDLVELLVSMSVYFGVERTVQSAVKIIGEREIHNASRYIQPLVLSTVTRKMTRNRPELLDEIRDQIHHKAKTIKEDKVAISRFKVKNIVWISLLLIFIVIFAPEVGELDDTFDILGSVQPSWLLAALLASLGTYFMSAIVLLGASPQALPFGRVFQLQFASTVINRITPKGLGGIALNERFLEKKGFNRIDALATISLVYFIGSIVHILLLSFSAFTLDQPVNLFDVDLTNAQIILIAITVAISLLGIVRIPRARYAAKRFLKNIIKNVKRGFEHPISLLQLVLGSAGITILYALSLHFSILAIGYEGISFNTVLLVYLAGSAIASAAPTPGGLGAVEAALAASLTLFDVPLGSAVAGVLLFRLLTFWLPILPGVVALYDMRQRQLV